MKLKLRLVEDWKKAHKWISVQCMAVSTAILTTWSSIPDDMKSHLPEKIVIYSAIGLMVIGILGRIIDQTGKEVSNDKPSN